MLCCCDPVEPTGACCEGSSGGIGLCFIRTPTECFNNNGVYQGNDTDCDPNPCPGVTGACCYDDGSCEDTELIRCVARGGTYQGDGTTCTPNPCPQPTGACCEPAGTCLPDQTETQCTTAGNVWQGAQTSCNPNPCPQPGPCQFCIQGDIPQVVGVSIPNVTVNAGSSVTWLRAADAAAELNAWTQIGSPQACAYQRVRQWQTQDPILGNVTSIVRADFFYELGANVLPVFTVSYQEFPSFAGTNCGFLWRAEFAQELSPIDCTAARGPAALNIVATFPQFPGGTLCQGAGPADIPLNVTTAAVLGPV